MILDRDAITDYSVENFIYFINENDIDKHHLIKEIKKLNLERRDQIALLKQIEFAYNRINSSLEITHAILLVFFPFGVINKYIDADPFFDATKQKELGFAKKVKQFYMFSLFGVLFYVILIIFLIFIV